MYITVWQGDTAYYRYAVVERPPVSIVEALRGLDNRDGGGPFLFARFKENKAPPGRKTKSSMANGFFLLGCNEEREAMA